MYLIYKHNIFFLNIYMHVCVFIYIYIYIYSQYTHISVNNIFVLYAINRLTALTKLFSFYTIVSLFYLM